MNIRFYGGRILCGWELTEGEVWIKDDRIIHVGKVIDAGEKPLEWDREIDLRGDILMPGFKNAHTHSPMTFLRSYADDMSLQEWLNNKVFPMEKKLKREDIHDLATLAFMEYLSSGITAAFDMYLYPEECRQAAIDAGFRTVFCGSVNDFTGSVEKMEREFRDFNDGGITSFILGFHAEYTSSEERLKKVSELAHKLKAPVFCHNSETRAEVEKCIEVHGATPTVYLDSLGMFDYGGGGFHCVYMSDEDVDIFARKGLWAVTNPGSNTKLASGIPDLVRLKNAGVGIAIGTDGAASNNCLDFFREMFLTAGLQKLKYGDAAAMDAMDVLKMATVNGAKAMGLTDCDEIAVGKKADMIVINMHRPNMQPENDILRNIVYSGSKENIRLTMIDGKILYENGDFHIGQDPEKIYRSVNEICRRIKL